MHNLRFLNFKCNSTFHYFGPKKEYFSSNFDFNPFITWFGLVWFDAALVRVNVRNTYELSSHFYNELIT